MVISLQDDAAQCAQAQSRDVGSESSACVATSAGRREPRGGDHGAGVLQPLHLQLAGDLSGPWFGSVEGAADPGAAEEAQSARAALSVPDGHGTQPAAAGLSVCAVDTFDDRALDRQAHRGSAEPGVGRTPACAVGNDLLEAPVAGLPTRGLAGPAVAQARLPAHPGGDEAGKGRDLPRGQVRGALGLSQRQDLDALRRDADCARHRAAPLNEHDLRDQPARGTALHGRQRWSGSQSVHRLSEASDAQATPPGVFDRGRSSLASGQGSEGVRGQSRGPLGASLSAAVLPGAQPRRTGLERCEEQRRRARQGRRPQGFAPHRRRAATLFAEAARSRPQLLPGTRDLLRGRVADDTYLLGSN